MSTTLYIGDPAYSSWSMRPYLALKAAAIAFDCQLVRLGKPETMRALMDLSPSRTVPVLQTGDLMIWDSLAICEWAAETGDDLILPESTHRRALARSVAATLHSGFAPLRAQAPMNLHRDNQPPKVIGSDAREAADHFCALIAYALDHSGGPFIAGSWSLADAMATPYATRFRSYGLERSAVVEAYFDRLFSHYAFQEWKRMALADDARKPSIDTI
jgi:glutathione S-transferase